MFEVGLINGVSLNMEMEDVIHILPRFMARSASDRPVSLLRVVGSGALISDLLTEDFFPSENPEILLS